MRVLPLGFVESVRSALGDQTVDILFNKILKRWVVVQRVRRPRKTQPEVRGCLQNPETPYTNFQMLFICESDQKLPIEPTIDFIVGVIKTFHPRVSEVDWEKFDKQEEEHNKRVKEEDTRRRHALNHELKTYWKEGKTHGIVPSNYGDTFQKK